MKLGTLITLLQNTPPSMIFPNGFGDAASWRGAYDEIAFTPLTDTKASDMLACALLANGKTYEGYKGGNYRMNLETEVNIAEWGEYGGEADELSGERWMKMLHEASQRTMRSEIAANNRDTLLELADEFCRSGIALGIAEIAGSPEAKAGAAKEMRNLRKMFQISLNAALGTPQ